VPEGVRIDLSPTPQIAFYNSAGVKMFSSADKLFRVTDVIIGTKQIASRATPQTGTTVYDLGNCHASADSVMGYIKWRYTESGFEVDALQRYLPANTWFYVSGSYVFARGSSIMAAYSFRASGGDVLMDEQLGIAEIKNSVGQSFPYQFGTMDYELWAGTFV
jgi:hypothetical protein